MNFIYFPNQCCVSRLNGKANQTITNASQSRYQRPTAAWLQIPSTSVRTHMKPTTLRSLCFWSPFTLHRRAFKNSSKMLENEVFRKNPKNKWKNKNNRYKTVVLWLKVWCLEMQRLVERNSFFNSTFSHLKLDWAIQCNWWNINQFGAKTTEGSMIIE